jgi:hypothetical protein
MELASAMKRDAVSTRKTRVRAFAESEVQRDINGAKNQGYEGVTIKVPVDVDMDMLQDYIADFGYSVTDAGKCDRYLRVTWDNPKK